MGEAAVETAKVEVVDETAIRHLVERFYGKVLDDPQLGPVFERAIGPAGAAGWEPHLDTMVDFWMSVMLKAARYRGNPMSVHMGVQGIAPELFAVWLRLFGETAAELFAQPIADDFADRAGRIAESLKLGLFYRPTLRPRSGTA